jgi:hypothetical protein
MIYPAIILRSKDLIAIVKSEIERMLDTTRIVQFHYWKSVNIIYEF